MVKIKNYKYPTGEAAAIPIMLMTSFLVNLGISYQYKTLYNVHLQRCYGYGMTKCGLNSL